MTCYDSQFRVVFDAIREIMRTLISSHEELAQKLSQLEKRYDQQFKVVFNAIREIMNPAQPPKKQRIGFGRSKET